MKRLVALLPMLLCAVSIFAQDPYQASTLVKKGQTVPSFSVTMLDGTSLTTKQLQSKVVLINFWATWCPYCIDELNHIQNGGLKKQMQNPDFVFLPISRGESRATVEAFVTKRGYSFDVAIDPKQEVWDKFATQAIPRNFVVDRNGKVTFVGVGYSKQDFPLLMQAIDQALK